MNAVEPILPFMGWIVLFFIGIVGTLMIGAINRYLDNMLKWQIKIEETLDEQGKSIVQLKTKIGGF